MPSWGRWVALATGLIITAVLAAAAAFCGDQKFWLKCLAAFYAVVPPVWFFVEWWLYKGPRNNEDFEHFKLSQERAKDVWLGLGAAIVIYFRLG